MAILAALASSCAVDGRENLTIEETLDLPGIHITKYRMGMDAAVSYAFDDGPLSSFDIAALFEQRGLRASFFIIPGSIEACCGEARWARWRSLSANGHEIANHTMSHRDLSDPTVSDAQLNTEIIEAQRLIEQRIGVRPATLAFPYGGATDHAMSVALQSHIATRNPGFPFDATSLEVLGVDGETTTQRLDGRLVAAANAGTWLVITGHGIDGDGAYPLASTTLAAHLDFALNESSHIWIDTFRNVAAYILASRSVHPSFTVLSPDRLRLRMEGIVDAAFTSVPLTVALPFRHRTKPVRVFDSLGRPIPAVQGPTALLLEILPLGEVEVRLSSD